MPISGSKILMVDGESSLPVLKALASETRMLILGLLSHNVLNVSELAAALDCQLQSQAIRVGGLIARRIRTRHARLTETLLQAL